MDRKKFIKNSIALCGAALMGAAFIESCQKAGVSPAAANVNFTLDLTDSANSVLNKVGGSVQHGSVIVIKSGSSSFSALSTVCTHQGCTIEYSGGSLICPCHGGRFDTNGNVLSGPPPSALAKYKTSLSGNILTVSS